jgi:hypothetical protein
MRGRNLKVYQRKQLPEPSNAGKTSPICLHQGLIELSTISNRYTDPPKMSYEVRSMR